jgi:hypothetical protein
MDIVLDAGDLATILNQPIDQKNGDDEADEGNPRQNGRKPLATKPHGKRIHTIRCDSGRPVAPKSHPSARLTNEPWKIYQFLAESLLTLALTPRSHPPSAADYLVISRLLDSGALSGIKGLRNSGTCMLI